MIILGINIGHDSGAALIDNGKLVAVNEERLSRIKMHHGFPYLSIEEVLSIANLQAKDIGLIAVEGKHIMPQFDIGFDEKTGDWKKQFISQLGLEKFLLGTETGLAFIRAGLKFHRRKIKNEIKKYFREK